MTGRVAVAIDRSRLARAAPAEVLASTWWSPRLAAARVASIALGGIGAVSVAASRHVVSPPSIPERQGGPVWFQGAAGAAFDAFGMDGASVSTLTASLLGVPVPTAARPPSPLERGLLAAALVPVLGALGLPGALVIDSPKTTPPARPALELSLRWGGGAGRAWIVGGRGGESTGTPPAAHAVAWLRRNLVAPASVELGRASVAASQWTSAGVGDAVVFAAAPLGEHHARPVVLRTAGLVAAATLDDAGDVRLVGPFAPDARFHPSPAEPKGAIAVPDPTSRSSSSPSQTVSDQVSTAVEILAEATVELVAEVGRTTLRGDELVGLIEGAVLALKSPSTDLVVTLSSAGRPVATGTLVDVEGELGVRISSRVR